MPTPVVQQNFDAAVVPAIPAGFTRENANIVTSAAHARSGANSLTNNSTTTYYFMCDTKEGNKGTGMVQAAAFFTAATGVLRLVGRGATEDRLACYELVVNPNGGSAVTLTRRAAGVPTTIGTPMGDGTTFVTNAWYLITLEVIGTSIRVQIQRDSDSKYLKSDNTWVTSKSTRCISVADGTSALAQASDFWGVALGTNAGAANEVYVDDFDILKPKINVVQAASAGSNNSSSVRTLAFGSNVTAGNFILIPIAVFQGSAVDITVTDSLGNEYHSLTIHQVAPGASKIFGFWAQNINGGACTVTVDPNGTSVYMGLGALEVSGPGPLSVIESWSSAHHAAVTAASAGTPPLMHDDDAVFAWFTQPAGTVNGTEGAMFTKPVNLNNSSSAMTLFAEHDVYPILDEDTPFTFASAVTYEALALAIRPDYTSTSQINQVPIQTNVLEYVSPTTSAWLTTPQMVTYRKPTTNGNLLLCAVGTITGDAGLLTTAVTDNKGNTWTLFNHEEDLGSGLRVELWKCANALGGANHQVTITPDDDVYISAVISEWSGSQGVTPVTKNTSGSSATPDSGNFSSLPHALTLAVMGHNATPGSTAAYQNSMGFPQNWTNLGALPALSQQTMGLSVIAFGDVTDDPGSTLDALWQFADTGFWVVTAVVLSPTSAAIVPCMGEDSMLLELGKAFTREFPIGTTGLTINIQLSKAGAALADPNAGASNLTEIGRGLYKFNLATQDVDTLGSLGYALTDAATNTTIYGHVVDRVWEITADIMTNPNIDNFVVPNTFGATFTRGGVIALNTDLIPLPFMTEPTERPDMGASLIDGISWICMLCVTKRSETDTLQQIFNIAGDTVISESDQSDNGTTYVHGLFSA